MHDKQTDDATSGFASANRPKTTFFHGFFAILTCLKICKRRARHIGTQTSPKAFFPECRFFFFFDMMQASTPFLNARNESKTTQQATLICAHISVPPAVGLPDVAPSKQRQTDQQNVDLYVLPARAELYFPAKRVVASKWLHMEPGRK